MAHIVAELFALWQQSLPRISGKSKLAEAIRYATARREVFERFLTDGLIGLDSKIVERTIRPQTLGRIANRWPSAKIDALMPWVYRPRTASASRLRRFPSAASFTREVLAGL